MPLFRKKADPISDRARTLESQIAQLESEIKRLDGKLKRDPTLGSPVSTAVPAELPWASSAPAATAVPAPPDGDEPIFEDVDQKDLAERTEPAETPGHYNELGVRKYDLAALFRRIQNHFRAPSTTNPKLVSYLAAGGIQGLRPLRYEKRVARNRFILLVVGLFLVLLGLIWVFVHNSL
jgi:hypothetical protein